MQVRLDYGRHGRTVQIPDSIDATILEPRKGTPLADPQKAIAAALASPIGTAPLAEIAQGRRNAAIVISDKTRPIPYATVLPPILAALESAGLSRDRIELLVATGLHRENTQAELIEMVGAEIAAGYRIRNHVARDAAAHTHVGCTEFGTEIWIDTGFLQTDLKIITGLIEPHLMAGYSGGRKAVVPGLAGVETMRSLHGPHILEARVGPGILDDNTFHQELLGIVRRVGVDFMVDVTIDRGRRVTGVFAGHTEQAHAAGTAFVEPHVHASIDAPADVVLISAGGYPLDGTFYQSIKGLTAALNIVRRGGTIVLLAEISEGIGSHEFVDLLSTLRSHEEVMARLTSPGFFRIDQWMVQHLCQVLRKAEVVLVTDRPQPGLRDLPITVSTDFDQALMAALTRSGDSPRLAIVPQGPYVLATVGGRKLALGQAWRDAA